MVEFSVIIPAYNSSGFIAKTLDSVKAQSCTSYELVITDDGSTDDTIAVIENYILNNPEMRIILNRQQNTGIGYARNASFRLASGNILAFLDNDDIWYPEKLQQTEAYYHFHPEIDILSHKVYKRYPDGRIKIHPTSNPGDTPLESFESLLLKGNCLAVSATSVRREAFERVGGFTGNLQGAEDYELWLRFASSGCTFGYMEEFLGEYARRPDSLSLSSISSHLAGVLKVVDKYAGVMLENNKGNEKRIMKAVKARKIRETISSALKLLRRGDYKAALKLLKSL